MKKTPFVLVAILGLAVTGCPDSKTAAPAPTADERAEKRAAEIVSGGLANEPAAGKAAEPVGKAESAEPVGGPESAEPVGEPGH